MQGTVALPAGTLTEENWKSANWFLCAPAIRATVTSWSKYCIMCHILMHGCSWPSHWCWCARFRWFSDDVLPSYQGWLALRRCIDLVCQQVLSSHSPLLKHCHLGCLCNLFIPASLLPWIGCCCLQKFCGKLHPYLDVCVLVHQSRGSQCWHWHWRTLEVVD